MNRNLKISNSEIQLKINAGNWKDAIKVAAKPLVEESKITQNYVDNMILSVKKLGPYIVIAPGLALGHARPSAAVKQTSFSIATLQKPVNFGSKDNDPVDIVIILASRNNTDHLELLQKVVVFLNDSANLKKLRAAVSLNDANKIANDINRG